MRATRELKISAEARDVLARSTVTTGTSMGWLLKLPEGQLDRKLYMEVDKILKSWHGKWQRNAGGHVFASDPSPLLLAEDGVEDKKWSLQQFFTPPEVALEAAKLAEVGLAHSVLEPSAGTGNLIQAVLEWWDESGDVAPCLIEKDPGLADGLTKKFATVICTDFLALTPIPSFDRVVMNPPFRDGQYARHVLHALKFLRPGGRLVAVVPHNWDDDEELKAEYYARASSRCTELDEGAFRASGTNIKCAIITMEAPK